MPREFIVTAPRTIAFKDYDEPALKPHEVRIRSVVSGIKTGTEMSLYRGTTPFRAARFDPIYRLFLPADGDALYPCRLGSWLAGEVVETGSAVTRFHAGQRVHGGMHHRPTNVVAETGLYLVPDGMDPETEVFVDPAIFALQSVHDAAIKVGDHVAIFGMGVIGLLAVQIARMSGAETVVAVDALPKRRDMAKRFGADRTIDPFQRGRRPGHQGHDREKRRRRRNRNIRFGLRASAGDQMRPEGRPCRGRELLQGRRAARSWRRMAPQPRHNAIEHGGMGLLPSLRPALGSSKDRADRDPPSGDRKAPHGADGHPPVPLRGCARRVRAP